MFKKVSSIKRSSDFEALKSAGYRKALGYLVLNYKKNNMKQHRLGLTIPKKTGNAVVRNKIKRWTKVIFKQHQIHFSDCLDINVIVRAPREKDFFKKLSFQDYKAKLLKAFAAMEV